ncbi:MAG: SDR family oxidoreductase [Spirulina sp. DLM2.Bin59]|nr:MAG: SDR family oxidoreductase [Spirulina sp. DLM2.Bin59]
MNVLITGGFGYLGGRIAVALAQTQQVYLGSRRVRPAPDWLPQAQTVAMDLRDPQSLATALRGMNAVVHLAAMNEHECVADPHQAVVVNTLGTLQVLEAAIAAGVERFIYFSTAHVYGSPLVGDITEATLPQPNHPYAITHRAAEDFVLAAHRQQRITGIVVRLSNGFGVPTHPHVNRWTLLVNDLCRQVVATRQLRLKSSGLQQRDFIPLADVARMVEHLLQLPSQDCQDGLFNVGSGRSLTILAMVQRIAAVCEQELGFTPIIDRPTGSTDSAPPQLDLHYHCQKIEATGFHLTGNTDHEIAQTLALCRDSGEPSPTP